MANKSKKELPPITEVITSIIDNYSFEDHLTAFNILKEQITKESGKMQKRVELAASALKDNGDNK